MKTWTDNQNSALIGTCQKVSIIDSITASQGPGFNPTPLKRTDVCLYVRLPRIQSDSGAFRSTTDWAQEIKNALATPPRKIFGKSPSFLSYIPLFKNV